MRQFDIRTISTNQGPGCNLLTEAVIRVVYELNMDLGRLDRIIAEDTQTISYYGIDDPSHWTNANSVFIPADTDVVAEIVNDNNGKPKNVVINHPLIIDFRKQY